MVTDDKCSLTRSAAAGLSQKTKVVPKGSGHEAVKDQ